jgi:hypothetical protein
MVGQTSLCATRFVCPQSRSVSADPRRASASDAFRRARVAPSRLFVEFAPARDGLIAFFETINWMVEREGRSKPALRQVALWLKSNRLSLGADHHDYWVDFDLRDAKARRLAWTQHFGDHDHNAADQRCERTGEQANSCASIERWMRSARSCAKGSVLPCSETRAETSASSWVIVSASSSNSTLGSPSDQRAAESATKPPNGCRPRADALAECRVEGRRPLVRRVAGA